MMLGHSIDGYAAMQNSQESASATRKLHGSLTFRSLLVDLLREKSV
jgi:hypothetical protein